MDSFRPAAVTVHAPAKINLSLHVVGRRSDGYHLLDGLVVFAEICDRLTISESEADGLTLVGPRAKGVPVEGNIVLRAFALARRIAASRGCEIAPLSLTLEKNLPAAAGIGGGSADAAALLRHLGDRHPELRDALASAAGSLGADVPMCLAGTPARIAGVGDELAPLAAMPALDMVLVNPGIGISTPSVFAALGRGAASPPPAVPEEGFDDLDSLVRFLSLCRNDLAPPAEALAPVVGEVTARLRACGAQLARMSGSGATVFALFETSDAAHDAARAIRERHPHWWVAATRSFGSTEKGSHL